MAGTPVEYHKTVYTIFCTFKAILVGILLNPLEISAHGELQSWQRSNPGGRIERGVRCKKDFPQRKFNFSWGSLEQVGNLLLCWTG